MSNNHNDDDDDDMVPDFLATLVNLLAGQVKMVNTKKQNKENSGSSNSTSNAVGKSNQKHPFTQGSSEASAAGGPKVRPTASMSSLSAGNSGNLKMSPKSANPPNGRVFSFPASRDSHITKKQQQLKIRPECDSISQTITASNGEASKAIDKQMVDLEKSFQEKAKFVATLKTICCNFEDSVKHAMVKESRGK